MCQRERERVCVCDCGLERVKARKHAFHTSVKEGMHMRAGLFSKRWGTRNYIAFLFNTHLLDLLSGKGHTWQKNCDLESAQPF
jgi:hypothetical protein